MATNTASILSPFQQVFDNFWNMPITNWDWKRFFNPQLIFNYNPDDEAIEYHVLQRVGSYGKQLSTVLKMLELMRQLIIEEVDTLDLEQKKIVDEFDSLLRDSRKAVEEYRGQISADELRKAIEIISELKRKDPKEFEEVRTKFV